MLYLVTVPSLPKRIQRNASSAEEAIELVWKIIPDRLRVGLEMSDCSADECPDPMSLFLRRNENGI
jgi:hypothetical protein